MKEARNIDIIFNPHFIKMNAMFKGVVTRTQSVGKGSSKNIQLIEAISSHKMELFFLHDIMNHPESHKLQTCVRFYIIYFFCKRTHDNLYEMTLDQFKVSMDNEGRRFVYQAVD